MNCEFCGEKIEGKSFTRTLGTCHPIVTYFEVEVCFKCKYEPKNNIESKKTLIK